MGLLSAVTGIIGGFQGASAAKNAANASSAGYTNASNTVNAAIPGVNSLIGGAATQAGQGVTDAASTAGQGVIANANNAATGASDAAGAAGQGVMGATGDANSYLNPYMQTGANATSNLNSMLSTPGQGLRKTFSADDMNANDPGYQFRIDQGQQALERSAAAHGASSGGGALKALANYAQGAASSEYGAAFDRFTKTQQQQYGMLSGAAGQGLAASGQAGANTIGAARYAGDTGINAAQYGGNVGIGAAQYAGNAGLGAAEYAGNAGINSAATQGRNTLGAAEYTGQNQINSANAQAAGKIGSANAWNGALNSIGSAGDTMLGNYSAGRGIFGTQPAAAGSQAPLTYFGGRP